MVASITSDKSMAFISGDKFHNFNASGKRWEWMDMTKAMSQFEKVFTGGALVTMHKKQMLKSTGQ